MTILLDSHALLWWRSGDPVFGPNARTVLRDPANHLLVGIVSLWEVTIKLRAGKLPADISDITDAVRDDGFIPLGIEPARLPTRRARFHGSRQSARSGDLAGS